MPNNYMASERAFLTLDEVALEIGCTRRFVEKRINDGELAVFRPSRKMVRVSRAELNRWIASYTIKATSLPKQSGDAPTD